MANSPSTGPVYLWTLGCIANSLQNGGLPCVRSSDNEDSELDLWDSGMMLLCSHSSKGLWEGRLAKVITWVISRRWIPLYVIITVQISYDYYGICRYASQASRIDPANQRACGVACKKRCGMDPEVHHVISARNVEEHDGCRRDLARPGNPGIRRHDDTLTTTETYKLEHTLL